MISAAAIWWFAAAAAPLRLEVTGCEPHFDPEALQRQLRLEWPDPPEGSSVEVHCSEAGWELLLEAPGRVESREQLALPELSRSSRARVLALLITERGRALSGLPPREEPAPPTPPSVVAPPPDRVAIRPEVRSEPATTEAEPLPSSPLRDSLFTGRFTDEAPSAWRLGVGAATATPLWLGPSRFGPQLKVQRGFVAIAVSGTFGSTTTKFGTVAPFSVTAEPELTLGCLRARWWQACGGVRGVFGYGAITARPLDPLLTVANRVEGPVLGGAATLSGALRFTDWLALDLDGAFGGAWAVYGSFDGIPVASLGGAFAGGSLSLVASWGAR